MTLSKKPKNIAFFKAVRGRNAGKEKVITFYAVRDDGTIRKADITRGITGTQSSFGSQCLTLQVSTEKAFNKALHYVLNT